MSEHFFSRDAAAEAALRRLNLNDELPEDAVRRLVKETVVAEVPGETTLPGHVSGALAGRYAIRNDELLSVAVFLDLLKSAARLAVGIAGLTTLAGAGAAIDGLHSFYKVFKDIKAKSFALSDAQFAAVTTLRILGSATAEEIASKAGGPMSPDQVDSALGALAVSDAQTHGVTRRDEAGRWSLVNL